LTFSTQALLACSIDLVSLNFSSAQSQYFSATFWLAPFFMLSERQLSLLEKHPHVSFIDARQEQIPLVPQAPSERDILFAARADLLVLLWDGQSEGTRRMLEWLSVQKKDHIIGYVPHI